jgi:hypothetical protein
MSTSFHDVVVSALEYLAGVCDYARSFDGRGFNKPDSHLGHDLTRRAQHRKLTDDEVFAAWALCRKYVDTQLVGAGIELPTADDVREHFGDVEPPEIARTPGIITLVDGELDVFFPYDPARVELLRGLRRRYGGTGFAERSGIKSWRLSLAALDDLLHFFPHFERWLDVDDVRRQIVKATVDRHQPAHIRDEARAQPPQVRGQVSLHGLHLRVEFPYDPALVQRIKALRQAYGGPGFQNDASGKYWLLARSACEALSDGFPELTWTEDADVARQRRAQQRLVQEQLPPLFR